MTTFDEAYESAAQLLDQRGLLLNVHLNRVVNGDEGLFQEVRERLIFDGLADDRFGVGLARRGPPGRWAARKRNASDANPAEIRFAEVPESLASDSRLPINDDEHAGSFAAEWWLMAGGTVQGPLTLATLLAMRQRRELSAADLVRLGERGLWRRPDDVDELFVAPESMKPVSSLPKSSIADRTNSSVTNHLASNPDGDGTASVRDDSAADLPETKALAAPSRSSRGQQETTTDTRDYFLWELGRPIGPITRDEVEDRLVDGRLKLDDFVQVGKDGDWQPVAKALNVERSPLRKPGASSALSDAEVEERDLGDVGDDARDAGFAFRTGSPRRADVAQRAASGTSAAKVKSSASTGKLPPGGRQSSLSNAWHSAADLVGGQRRLTTALVSIVAVAALVVWWRQPPSASAIYREFTACHLKLKDLRTRRAGPTDWSMALTRERPRVQSLIDGLKKRASAARPAEQELFWAGQFGLLELLKNPPDATEFERAFTDHMSHARLLIDPKAAPALAGTSPPSASGFDGTAGNKATALPASSAQKSP